MDKIYEIFSDVLSSLGYSRAHASVLTALLVYKELSLKEIVKKTRYSLASVSLSLDLLELFGLVRRIRKDRSKEIYVRLEGDLLIALKEVVLRKIKLGIESALRELEKEDDQKIKKIKKEVLRLKNYIDRLNKVEIPK